MKNKLNYTGKTIFVGIDVHKKTYSVAVICENMLVKKDTILAQPEKLGAYLKKYFSGAKIKSSYEAGFSGYVLHRYLEKQGIENIVVHAASIEISANNKVKTDKRDALKIATQLSAGRLRSIHIPSEETEDKRELTRLREDLVKEKTRVTVKLKSKANYYGLLCPEEKLKVSKKWIEKILKKPLPTNLFFTLNTLFDQWTNLTQKIKEIDAKLKEQAKEDKNEHIYRSAKGVGPTASRILSNELGDMSHFSSERDLFSFTGLTPREHSSGEHTRKGHISRQGKPILRKTLVQCSWVTIRYDKSLAKIYERIKHRAGGKRAIIAVARRLVGRLRACLQRNEFYQESKLQAV